MSGFGGRHYLGRRTRQGRVEGVVVASWMSSQDKHLRSYVQLYESLGWNSLVCHSQFLNMFFPEKALPLAVDVVKELVNELRIRACPIVFASFSVEPKACMSKVLEVLEGQGEAQVNMLRSVRADLLSHVLGLPVKFCQMHLPKADTVINLIDEKGEGSPVIYLARK